MIVYLSVRDPSFVQKRWLMMVFEAEDGGGFSGSERIEDCCKKTDARGGVGRRDRFQRCVWKVCVLLLSVCCCSLLTMLACSLDAACASFRSVDG
jgi:hypothetical protein